MGACGRSGACDKGYGHLAGGQTGICAGAGDMWQGVGSFGREWGMSQGLGAHGRGIHQMWGCSYVDYE